MIQVMEGYKLKPGASLDETLIKLRTTAMGFYGFVGAQNLRTKADPAMFVLVSTWENPESWNIWESSRMRQQILAGAEPLLAEKLRVTVYEIVPTNTWG